MDRPTQRAFLPCLVLLLVTRSSGTREWDADSYPNPLVNAKDCGNEETMLICDPDGVLDSETRKSVHKGLLDIRKRTVARKPLPTPDKPNVPPSPFHCDEKGLTIGIALTKRLYHSPEISRIAAQEKFAYGVAEKWSMDPVCNKDILITLAVADKHFTAALGHKSHLSLEDVRNIFISQYENFKKENFAGALETIALKIENKHVRGVVRAMEEAQWKELQKFIGIDENICLDESSGKNCEELCSHSNYELTNKCQERCSEFQSSSGSDETSDCSKLCSRLTQRYTETCAAFLNSSPRFSVANLIFFFYPFYLTVFWW